MKIIIRLYTFPKYNHVPWAAGLNCRSQIRLFCAHSPKSTETSLGYYTCQLSHLQTKDIDLTHRGQFLTDLTPDSNIWTNFSQHISKKSAWCWLCVLTVSQHAKIVTFQFTLTYSLGSVQRSSNIIRQWRFDDLSRIWLTKRWQV